MSSWWAKYQALSPRTKAIIGVGVIGYGIAGLYLSDAAEEKFGYTPKDEDKEQLRRMIPTIRTVGRDDSPLSRDAPSPVSKER